MADKIRVLVVDDSALMRKLLSNMLNADADIEVIATARDGRDALDKVLSFHPDVVTLDVEMPRVSGLEALEYIMAWRPTPVIV
ncbi:MAG: response regulator, partial [Anaerolineae bacterium]|nr:response regulator [Anaerolineae bacterium]